MLQHVMRVFPFHQLNIDRKSFYLSIPTVSKICVHKYFGMCRNSSRVSAQTLVCVFPQNAEKRNKATDQSFITLCCPNKVLGTHKIAFPSIY